MAERLFYVVKKYNLLPRNYFGARRRRLAKQALTLIQEKICGAWKSKKVLSLLSFEVKGVTVCPTQAGVPHAARRW